MSRQVSAEVLRKALVAKGIPPQAIVLMDEEYYLPPSSWITKDLAASLNKFLFDTGFKYTADRFDCNHFTKTACAIADWCWQETKGAPEAALAFGLFGFASQGHVICVALDEGPDPNLPLVSFYEPQPGVPDGHDTFALVCLLQKRLDAQDIGSCLCCWFF